MLALAVSSAQRKLAIKARVAELLPAAPPNRTEPNLASMPGSYTQPAVCRVDRETRGGEDWQPSKPFARRGFPDGSTRFPVVIVEQMAGGKSPECRGATFTAQYNQSGPLKEGSFPSCFAHL